MTTDLPQKHTGLRAGCLSFLDVFSQSIALISPTFGAALSIPLVFEAAGNASWLTYIFATTGLVLVGLNINEFARHSASAGALYVYVAKSLGTNAGILCGWALTLAYPFVAGAAISGSVHYINLALGEFEIQLPSILVLAVCIGISWYYAYTDIQLSAVLMLMTELIATIVILVLAYLVIAQHGFHLDIDQLRLAGATPSGISLGMVIGIFSYVGFESAATLGEETKAPFRSIPHAVLSSTVLAGLFFIVLAYAEVLGFRGSELSLSESADPLGTLANLTNVQLLGVGLNLGIAFSCFSCCLASINAGSRIAYALSHHHFYPAVLGQTHKYNKTPHIAVTLLALSVFLLTSLMSLFGIQDIKIYSYLATIATYGFVTTYLLVSIAAPVYLAQQGKLKQHHLIVSLLAGFFMILPIAGSFYPVPAFPFNIFPYLFLLYLAAGVWFFQSHSRRSRISNNIGRDLESQQRQIG